MQSDEALISQALAVQTKAYAPYSNFQVGAALESQDGTVFTGCNVENAAYGSCLCAERGALMKAISEGRRAFRRIAIVGSGGDFCAPCGACRQMLYEFAPNLEVIMANHSGESQNVQLSQLLPHGFGSNNLV